ncbi:MAG: D-sedoheptulose 7-phosphate isomerase [Caldisericaceae bacterium]|nr:D-sedoheptulose 7-phosphate isomerase [Caldisericaceae bacterium]
MNFKKQIINHFEESIQVKKLVINHCTESIRQAIEWIIQSFKNSGKILICGNGGSAADSQHIAAEFVIRLSHELERPGMAAIALTTDSSVLTAGSNDLGFEQIFARQVEALGQPGDILIGITTSGNSKNIIEAIHAAKSKQMKTIGLLGNDGGKCKELVDLPILVPSVSVQHIQEAHITIGHIIVELAEKSLFAAY